MIQKYGFCARECEMTEAEEKAQRNEDSTRQEQEEVKRQRDKKNVSYRIAREIDTLTVERGTGIIWLCDCKSTDGDMFYIENYDVQKGLDEVLKWREALGRPDVPVRFRVEIFFKGHRSNNKRYIPITEMDRGYTLKVTRGKGRITVTPVKARGL
jgi:hypothetical protein